MIYSHEDLKKAFIEGFRRGVDAGDRHGDYFGLDGPTDARCEEAWEECLASHRQIALDKTTESR